MSVEQAQAAIRRQRILLIVGLLLMGCGFLWSVALTQA